MFCETVVVVLLADCKLFFQNYLVLNVNYHCLASKRHMPDRWDLLSEMDETEQVNWLVDLLD